MKQDKPPAPAQTAAELEALLAAAKPGAGVARTTPAPDEAQAPELPAGPKRCGLIAIVGKPNVGKSTLMNALVGQKISITSRKAQTTRHRITGIRSRAATQYVFVDTPGFQTKHSTALNKSLNKTVMGAIGDVDLILFVVEAGQFTLRSLPGSRACRSAIRSPNSCPCRPRARAISSACSASARSTCPSRTGCMPRMN
jgi:GTP-binding protein Era